MLTVPTDAPQSVLVDIFHVTILSGLVALVVYRAVRGISPLRRWGSHGNVFTGRIEKVDLLVASLFIGYAYLLVAGDMTSREASREQIASDGIEALLVAQIVQQLFFVGLVVFYLGFLRRVDLSEFFGLGHQRFSSVVIWAVAGTLLVAIPGAIAALNVNLALMERAGMQVQDQLPVQLFQEHIGGVARALMIFSFVLAAPIYEEVLFRGFIYPVSKRYTDRFFAALFSSAIFALAHNDLGTLLPLFVLGISFALAFELSGSILVPIVMHAIFNGINVVRILRYGTGVEGG